ncbi:hypothetical protein BT69DRAFT_1042742 [Atractiella rhizophila]|nr:hypothetical protein BT69DRAFT_1042742 [Atractiella rhizophila]
MEAMDVDGGPRRGHFTARKSFPTGRGAGHTGRSSNRYNPMGGRPNFSRSTSSTADAVDKWDHDLFSSGSSLYEPKLNPTSFASSISPSLRPFGNATPMGNTAPIQRPVSAPPVPAVKQEKQKPLLSRIQGLAQEKEKKEKKEGGDLLTRLGMGGGNQVRSLKPAPPVTPKYVQPVYSMEQPVISAEQERRYQGARDKEKQRVIREGPLLVKVENLVEGTTDEDVKERRYQGARDKEKQRVIREGPLLVKVENLVEGTTDEDVKTAFQDFGTILDCRVDPLTTGDLMATMVFVEKRKAEDAVNRLNGALADGRVLNVFTENLPQSSIFHPLNPKNPSYNEGIFGPRPQSAPVRTLYSDELIAADPRASIMTKPQSFQKIMEPRAPQRRRAPGVRPHTAGGGSLLSRIG